MPGLQPGEHAMTINGGTVIYEIVGECGDLIALTPGGRFSKDSDWFRPLAVGLAGGGYRVLLWDRPNCGRSDVQFFGASESHMRAETLYHLLTRLNTGPCIFAGGSSGARDSMLTAILYPELVSKLVLWNIVGGIYGSFFLGSYYVIPSIVAVRGLGSGGIGMEALLNVPDWQERIAASPNTPSATARYGQQRFPTGDEAMAHRICTQDWPDIARSMMRCSNASAYLP